MKKLKKVSLFVVLMLMLGSLAACAGGKSEEAGNTTTIAEGENTVVVGYSGPLSGAAAQYGINVLNGLKMAADEINETGFEVDGKTYKIKLVPMDDKYLPNETGVNVQRMATENAPVAVWIPHSGGVFASLTVNEKENVIIMAQTSEPRMYEQGNKMMIGISPQYSIWPKTFSKYIMENYGKKMALIPTNSQYGKDWLNVIEPVWEEMGGEFVFKGEIDFSKDTDYFTIMTNVLQKEPDVLFVGGPSEPTAKVVKQSQELGFDGAYMIMDQAKMEEMSGVLEGYDKLNGSVGVLPVDQIGSEASNAFVKNYQEKFNVKYATADSSLSYQGLYVLVEAMKAAKTVEDRSAIMAAVNEGIPNIPEEKAVIPLTGISDVGSLQWEIQAGVVEDGEVIALPLEK
ncbi:MAG: ABC transporter substrate-binding protein [Bacillota bacterium]